MAENLKYAYLGKTKELDSSSFCYNNSLEYCEKYGRYYLWSAAMDSAGIIPGNVANHCGDNRSSGATCECGENSRYIRGACPEGWYLPIRWDWQTLLIATDSNETSLRSANISNELKEACVELNTKNRKKYIRLR
jgi:Fibrobacter succinogenes major domain (Fib_succ_major).